MRMEQLICLVEIFQQKSINIASESLHMTQQALSSSMKTLENELGVQLLHRTRKGCSLTHEGEKLLDFARDILPRYQSLCDEFRRQNQASESEKLEGRLHIYVNSVFYLSLLSDTIKIFCEKHPQLKVVVLAHSPAHICEQLQERPRDGVHRIGFVNVPCAEDGLPHQDFLPARGLRFHPLARGSYVACVGKNSPLAAHKELSIKALLRHPLIIGASDDADITPLHWLISRYGKPHIALSVASLPFWNQAVNSNVGVGFLHAIFLDHPEYMQKYVHDMALIQIQEKLMAVTGYLTTARISPVVEKLIHCLHPLHTQ